MRTFTICGKIYTLNRKGLSGMKKLIISALILLLALNMAACGSKEEEKEEVVTYTEVSDLFHIEGKDNKAVYFITADMDEITFNTDKVTADVEDITFAFKWVNKDGEVLAEDEDTYTMPINFKKPECDVACEITAISGDKKQVETETFEIRRAEHVDLESYITSGANMYGPRQYGIEPDDVEYFSFNFAIGESGLYKLEYTKAHSDDKKMKIYMTKNGELLEPSEGKDKYQLFDSENYGIVVSSHGARFAKLKKVD